MLVIGKNVDITNASIMCSIGLTIGDNSIVGAGFLIMNRNFHSVQWEERQEELEGIFCGS